MTSIAAVFDENYYLTNNADVVLAISQGQFANALDHYTKFGGKELRLPNATFNPSYYAINNSDVLSAVSAGGFAHVFAHYQEFGETESRAPSTAFAGFDSTAYLAANADVAAAVTAGQFASALDHFITFGQNESRSGSGVTEQVVTGSNLVLSTSADTITGTANNDALTGLISNTAADSSLEVSDSIDLGAGTDTVTTSLILGGAINSAGIRFNNVETASFRSVDSSTTAHTATVDVALMDASTYAIEDSSVQGANDDTIALTGFENASTLRLARNDTDLDVTVTTDGTATSGDAFALTVAGGSTGDVTINDGAGDGVVTLNIAANTAASTLASINAGTDNTTINVTGDQGLTITGALQNAVTTFSASGSSGAIDVNAAATSDKTFTGGSGTTDKLSLTLATSVASGLAVTAFETVAVSSSAASTLDLDLLTGVTAATGLQVDNNGTANTGALTLDDVADGVAINFVGGGTDAASTHNDVTVVLKDITGTTANSNGESLVVNVNNDGTATGAANDGSLGDLVAAGIETITMNFADYSDADADDITIAAAESLTVTGSTDVTFGGTNDFTNLETLSAGTMTGDFNIGTLTGAVGALTATFGAGADTVTNGTVTGTQTINTGAGNDTVTVAETTNGTITINLGDGADNISIAANDDNGDTVNIDGGAGTDILSNGAGGASIDSLTNVEQVRLTATNNLNIDTATGYDDALEIFELSGGTASLSFTSGAAGNTMDLSNLTFAGWTSGTDVLTAIGSTGTETITGTSVADNITGLAGADTINVGATAGDAVIISAAGQTADFTTPAAITASTVGMDIVSGLIAGDDVVLSGYTGIAATNAADNVIDTDEVTGNDLSAITLATNKVFFIRGDYSSANDLFTEGAGGADTLFAFDADVSQNGADFEAMILVGTGANTFAIAAGTGGVIDIS